MSEEHRQHHINLLPGEAASTVLIPDDSGRVQLFAESMDEAEKVTQKREYITYTGKKGGTQISCTSTGLGSSPTAIGAEELVRIGTKNIIRIGTCRAIQSFVQPGDLIIATGAVRGERATEELIPIDYPAVADFRIVRALIEACTRLEQPYHLGIVRTHDALYLEAPFAAGGRPTNVQQWVDLGVLAQDNETSALFVVAGMQGVRAGAILLYSAAPHDKGLEERTRVQMAAGIEAARILHEKGLD